MLLRFVSVLVALVPAFALAGDTSETNYQLYRNATAKLQYAGKVLLLDPMLSAKGDLPSFAGRAPNPTVDLPVPAEEIVDDIDGVIVGHLHPDYFDAAAVALLDKNLAIVTPNNSAPVDPRDPLNTPQSFKEQLNEYGFENVTTLSSERVIEFMGVRLTQEFGQHGFGDTVPLMGGVNGIIFQATEAPTIYWTRDSVLDQEGQVLEILERYRPDVVIAHTGGNDPRPE